MNCKTVVANLASLIDQQVDPVAERDIRTHLELCESCQTEEREMRALKRLLANSETYDLDPLFEARLRDWIADPSQLRNALEPTRRFPSVWQLAPVTLVALWLVSQTLLPTPVEGDKSPSPVLGGRTFAAVSNSAGVGSGGYVGSPHQDEANLESREFTTVDLPY